MDEPSPKITRPFHITPRKLPPHIAEKRAQLAVVLASMQLPETRQRTEGELLDLCSRLGMWPVSLTRNECLRDLAWVGPRLIPLFAECPPEQQPRFERWQKAIERGDPVSAAHWLIRLGLWPVPSKA